MTSNSETSPVDLGVQDGAVSPMRCRGNLLAAVLAAALAAGCSGFSGGPTITGSGQPVSTPFNLTGFSRVAAGNAFQVDIAQGATHSVTVTVDDNLVEYLDVTKSGDTLRIHLKPNIQIRQATLKATVTMPALAGLNLSGATRTTVTGFQSGESFNVDLSGASRLGGDIKCGEARFHLSGASRAELRGGAGQLRVDASGASKADLERYESEGASVRASGASHVTVRVDGDLEVDASGASSVRYIGEATRVNAHASGASSVQRK